MRLAEINVFPVKGCAGFAPQAAKVEPWGVEHDRRWMVVDDTGRMITQRVLPLMARLRATHAGPNLTLCLAGHGTITVPQPDAQAERIAVRVWRDTLPAALADDATQTWLQAALETPCRLIHMQDTAARKLPPNHAPSGETVSFADGFPVLLTSLGSLADLNTRLATPIPISRFRANLVISGAGAWAEDTWRVIRIGAATFRIAKPCDRCIVTTIDQATGERPDRMEPLRTLGTFRHDERGIMFGQNLIPTLPGPIQVGDTVEILEQGPPNVTPIPH